MKQIIDCINDNQEEIAYVNAKDISGCMPINKYKIEMRSNDHEPAHVYVLFDGNDIAFTIEDGVFYKTVKDNGVNISKLEKTFKSWLNQNATNTKKVTNKKIKNKDFCLMLWNIWH